MASLRKVSRMLCTRAFLDSNSDYRNCVVLAGNGRGGTTWVSDIINYNNKYRYIFEPFHPHKVAICKRFRYRQYLRPDNRDLDFTQPAKAILTGRVRSRWTDSQNRKFLSKKRLVKDIRANHLLKWMQVNFPGVPIILLLRHPCAVANSKLQLDWETHLEEFLAQRDLMEDFLNPFRKEIEEARSTFEKHVFMWCIENYVPLNQFKSGEIHLAFYENFCESPRQEIDRLFSFLGEKYDQRIFQKLSEPSSMSRKGSAISTGESLIDSWRKHVNKDQLERALEILSLFGLNRIYSRDSKPRMDATEKMFRTN